VTTTVRSFDAPITAVYATLVEPTTYPHWLVGAKRIREVAPLWPAAGTWFEHVVGFGPLQLPDRTTSLGADAPHRLELLVRARPLLKATVKFELVERASGCLLTMTETPQGTYRHIAKLAAPVLRKRNERSLQRLAAAVDQARETSSSQSSLK
jgi:uncharacterized protein YndB with AHSA1/START domain